MVVYEHGVELGWLQLNVEEYVGNYLDYSSSSYTEKVKIAEGVTFEFEMFLGTSAEEVSDLLVEFKGESNIKTPMTRQSREQDFDLDRMLASAKQAESEIYSPTLPISKKLKESESESIQ